MSRRSVRTERRLFLADGPKAVEGALGVDGLRRRGLRDTRSGRRAHAALLASATVTLVDDRALASLSDSVSPAGVVAVCRHVDAPLEHVVRGVAAPARHLRRRARPRQRRHRHPHRRRRRRRRRRARRPVGRRLQPQDRPRHGRQPVPPAGRGGARPRERRTSRAGARAHRARRRRRRRGRPLRRRPVRADRLAVRQRGLGPARGARGARRPPGRHPDPRPRREPQPLHRGRRVPLRQRARPARRRLGTA